MDEKSARLTAKMQELVASGLIINWMRIDTKLRVLYPHGLPDEKVRETQSSIAKADGVTDDDVQMISRNPAVDGTEFGSGIPGDVEKIPHGWRTPNNERFGLYLKGAFGSNPDGVVWWRGDKGLWYFNPGPEPVLDAKDSFYTAAEAFEFAGSASK